MRDDGRIVVGILIGNICAAHTDEMLNGLVHRADENEVCTMFFMGAHANCFDELHYYEGGNKEQKYLFQFNTIFDYAKVGKLDVLIVMYSTFYLYVDESKEEFFKRFEDLNIPIIIVGDEYGDYTSAISDNYDGIRKCMEHLIFQHNYKKIAYLSGPVDNNKDARERLEAYYEVMKECGFEVKEGYVQFGDYSANSAPLFGKILDTHPDIEGVVCANDTMALCGYEECSIRGLRPGVDVAITGFDDIAEARTAIPPLTTVEQNSYDLGYMAMRKAIELANGGSRENELVPVYFKHRESCGSKKDIQQEIQFFEYEKNLEEIIDVCTQRVLDEVFWFKLNLLDNKDSYHLLYAVFMHIGEVYLKDEDINFDVEFIEVSIRTLLSSKKIAVGKFITEFYKQMMCIALLKDDVQKRRKLTLLLSHILNYIQNTLVVDNSLRVDDLQRNIWTTPFITRDMIGNIDDAEQMYECIMERLRFMKINNAYLFLLTEPHINNCIQDWQCPENAFMVACIEDGRISVKDTEKVLSREKGLSDILTWESGNHMANYTLFAGKRIYGMLSCEMTNDNITSMYSASLHIGSAFQFIELTRKQRLMQEQLQEAMNELTRTNSILNLMSEKDELTGLYNRRGFLENAMSAIARGRNGYVLCIYADLDHLKQINDEFGHSEGDFAIRKAGDYLQGSLRSTDAVGRIGGDEFAALAIVKQESQAGEIIDRIILSSKMFNRSLDKPYYVEISIGYVVYKWNEKLELNEMLSAADKMLYKSKLKRRKDARKESTV